MKKVMNKRAQFFILSAVIIASIVVGLATVRNSVDVGAAPAKFYYYSQQLNEETGAVVDYALYSGEDGKIEEFLAQGFATVLSSNPDMEIVSCYTNKNKQLTCTNNGTTPVTIIQIDASGAIMGSTTLNGTKGTRRTGTTELSGSCYVYDSGWFPLDECPTDCIDLDGYNIQYGDFRGTCEEFLAYRQQSLLSQPTGTAVGCSGTCSVSDIKLKDLQQINITSVGGTYPVQVANYSIQKDQFYFIFKINTTSGDYRSVVPKS